MDAPEVGVSSTDSSEPENDVAAHAPISPPSDDLAEAAEPLDRALADLYQFDAPPDAPIRPWSDDLTDDEAVGRVLANLLAREAGMARAKKWLPTSVWVGVAMVAIIVAGLVLFRTQFWRPPTAVAQEALPLATEGMAIINSRPDGAVVVIDGEQRGVTPLKLTLKTGEHALHILKGSDSRVLSLTIESGVVTSQYVELPVSPERAPAAGAAVSTGLLEISSDPQGASVTVDGQERGTTPVLLKAVKVGRHNITISQGETAVRRSVVVSAGAHAVVDVSLTAEKNVAGWIALTVPFEVRVAEAGRVLATTSGDTLMLLAGHHNLEVSNDSLEFRTNVDVQVPAGETVPVAIAAPNGSTSVNALPWAEVFVDGHSVGTTPLGNLSLPVGRHEIVFRHPQLGERRQSINVTARTPVRVGVDFTR